MVLGLVATWNDTASSATTDFFVNKVDRGGWGAPRDVSVSVPGKAGVWRFDEQRGERNISMAVTLVASSIAGRRSALSTVFGWLDVIGRKKLIFSDQPDRYWYASLSDSPSVDEMVQLGRFNVNFVAEPYALGVDTSEECASGTPASESDSFSVPDDTDAEVEVTIVPSGGSLTGLSFTLNGDTITWEGNIPDGNTLTISSISSTVLSAPSNDTQLVGLFDPDDLDMGEVTGTFGFIVPGNNDWSLTGITGTLTTFDICFNWRRRYH